MRGKIGTLLAAVAAAAGAAGAAKWAKGRKDEEARDREVGGAAGDTSADASKSSELGSTPVASAAEVPVAAPPEATPAATNDSGADDLTAIKGLGKVKAARLAEAGIISFAQVAAWTDDDIAEVGLKVNTSPGQIKREDWVGQASTLADQ